jgi:multiple sugar transport system permease protein
MAWRSFKWPVYHIVVAVLAVLMLYPVLWMFFSSFKESRVIFLTADSLFPDKWIWSNYSVGWKGTLYPFSKYMMNTLVIVVIATIGAVASSSLIAFGFARLRFVGQKFWFALMMVTLMLPHDVVLVPQYVIFTKLGWLNTILPLVIPSFFGMPFFIFLMVQFIRTIPGELDDAAAIDGCGKFRLYLQIIMPLLKSSLATAAIFSFYWRWEDLLGPLLYLNSPEKYTVSMALKMFLDSESASNWGAMFAMSIVSLIPVIAIFFVFQKQIVEGMTSGSLKG